MVRHASPVAYIGGLGVCPQGERRDMFDNSYLDVRSFTLGDWAEHRELVAAIVARDERTHLRRLVEASIEQGVTQATHEFRK